MMIKRLVSCAVMCVAVCAALSGAVAQDAAQQPEAASAESVDKQHQDLSKLFQSLVMVSRIHGLCEVLNPDIGSFTPAIDGKAYPLGTVVRTGADGAAVLVFSVRDTVSLYANTEVVADRNEQNPDMRVLRLFAGSASFDLRDNLPEGSFTLETANAVCKNVTGRGDYQLYKEEENDVFQAATITGSSHIVGPHYHIPALRAANTVNIMTAPNRTLSRLTSVSGDFMVVLEKGGEVPVEYAMSPKAVIKIWRENAPVGGRTIISTLVVSPNGIACHRFAYAEGREDLATGELVTVEEEEIEMPVLLSDKAKKDGDADNDADDSKSADEN